MLQVANLTVKNVDDVSQAYLRGHKVNISFKWHICHVGPKLAMNNLPGALRAALPASYQFYVSRVPSQHRH